MRIPLELQQVMQSPTQARPRTLSALRKLLTMAEHEHIYLDIAGNLVWRGDRAPDWYDRLPERSRWQVQATFWRAVAHAAATSPAVLCYELTSEPTVADAPGYYPGGFGGWTFVQVIAHPHGRNPRMLARSWTKQLAAAVHSQDNRPVTIGMLPSGEAGFSPASIGDLLDMLTLHEYPETGKASESIGIVRHYASFGKPVLLGETFALWSDLPTQRAFLLGANRYLIGVFEFFDGRDPDHMKPATIPDAIYQASLRQFMTLRGTILKSP